MRSFRYYTGALRSPIAPVFLGVFTAFQQQALSQRRPTRGHLAAGIATSVKGVNFKVLRKHWNPQVLPPWIAKR